MNQRQLVQAAVAYVEEHLNEPLTLDGIAAAIYYSKHHLLHEFSAYTKYSLYDYIKKRRLHDAAFDLLNDRHAILDVALNAGYQTQQSFTKAFSELYKISPKEFRGNKKPFGIREALTDYDQLERNTWESIRIVEADIGDRSEIVRYMRASQGAFPYWTMESFDPILTLRLHKKEVIIAKADCRVVGMLMIDSKKLDIEGLSSFPAFWEYQLEFWMLQCFALKRRFRKVQLETTSFRSNDKLDIGYRAQLLALGFSPIEQLKEFNYPTEKFIFSGPIHWYKEPSDSILLV